MPAPSSTTGSAWIEDFTELYPEDATSWSVVYGDIPSLEIPKLKYEAIVESLDTMQQVGDHAYPVVGTTDWSPIALSILENDPTAITWVGDTGDLTKTLAIMRQQGWTGRPLLEGTAYEDLLFGAGNEAVEGAAIRMYSHPFEEADKWPATKKYVELMDQYAPDGTKALLGIDSMSAWLLFATAANACGDANDGVLTRDCILTEAAAVDEWTGGGLHSPADPEEGSEAVAGACTMLLTVKDGKFERLFPEIGGDDDDEGLCRRCETTACLDRVEFAPVLDRRRAADVPA